MGFLQDMLGDRIQPAPPPAPLPIHATGDHSITAETALAQTHENAINPMNGDRFLQQNFRSAPVCTEPRGFTAAEADAIALVAEMNGHKAKHAVRAFNALARNEKHDATIQTSHRQYLGAVASAELQKVGANASLARKLQAMRPAYAALGLMHNDAERTANNRVGILKARIAGVLN